MEVIFSDESRICIGRGKYIRILIWCLNETYEDDLLKKT